MEAPLFIDDIARAASASGTATRTSSQPQSSINLLHAATTLWLRLTRWGSKTVRRARLDRTRSGCCHAWCLAVFAAGLLGSCDPVDLGEQGWQCSTRAQPALPAGAACVVCSVRPEADAAATALWLRLGGTAEPEFFGRELPVPMPVRVAEPDKVGTDRLLLALGAKTVAGAPCIVVSAGTAITVDVVDADGFFAGGAIAPGFGLAADALHEKTAFLPRVRPAPRAAR